MSRHRRAHGRDIDGILLLDKSGGMTSSFALQRVKQIFNANKAGHTGALDPLATGMLPICLGEATKFSQLLLDSDKSYEVTARLGVRTDTSDSDGQVISRRPNTATLEQIRQALSRFRGNIMQVPSMYSALKHKGKPLYEYARSGIAVEREPRPITVYLASVVSYQGDDLSLEIRCSKGTYIRTIIDDLGEMLGCGAHVIRLNRVNVGSYDPSKMVTLDELNRILEETLEETDGHRDALDRLLLPVDSAVMNLKACQIPRSSLFRLMNGQALEDGFDRTEDGSARLYDRDSGCFLGVADIENSVLKPRRLVRSAQVLSILASLSKSDRPQGSAESFVPPSASDDGQEDEG
ncbi:MAG: tRNA pseudouridine(55) synthase TruB [Succinivibrionaceae bacterium]|nr:tRNA pseudouridine(55) synthase TruB [Succinivibrionaceae bacterium]